MNTTPSTPEPAPVPYTIVGNQGQIGNERAILPFSVMVLHRNNSWDRQSVFDRLHRLNARMVLSVETGPARFDIEAYANAYREFRFMVVGAPVGSIGELINLAMNEITTPLVLVIWSDTTLLPVSRSYLDEYEQGSDLCITPYLRAPDGTLLPSLHAPGTFRKGFQVHSVIPSPERRSTLLPHDYMGLYRREAFLQCGGYDPAITSPWWQKLDLGMRARLWGWRMHVSAGLRIQCQNDPVNEDTSSGTDYSRFYGKNLLPEFRADHAALPLRRFFHYRRASTADLAGAWKEFRELLVWVNTNRYRFRTEAASIVDFWEREDELYQ